MHPRVLLLEPLLQLLERLQMLQVMLSTIAAAVIVCNGERKSNGFARAKSAAWRERVDRMAVADTDRTSAKLMVRCNTYTYSNKSVSNDEDEVK